MFEWLVNYRWVLGGENENSSVGAGVQVGSVDAWEGCAGLVLCQSKESKGQWESEWVSAWVGGLVRGWAGRLVDE